MSTEETLKDTVDSKKGSIVLNLLGVLFYLASFCCTAYGLTKIFMYRNYGKDLSFANVNAYVGGDAYNYIINGTHATTFCVIAVMCAIMGSTCFIVNAITKHNKE